MPLFRKHPIIALPPSTIICAQCGHVVAKDRAYSVEFAYNRYNSPTTIWYCGDHRKPYDHKQFCDDSNMKYWKLLEVAEDGTPVGYRKHKVNSYGL